MARRKPRVSCENDHYAWAVHDYSRVNKKKSVLKKKKHSKNCCQKIVIEETGREKKIRRLEDCSD